MPKLTGTLISCCAMLALAFGSAACGGGRTSSSGGQAPGSASTTPAAPASSRSGSATAASCPSGQWQTGPVTVTRQLTVPPVPVATAITTGSHPDCRFDRLVISFSGSLPGYQASFVTSVIQDGSGKTISLPGSRYLVLALRPAQGHDDSGNATLPSQVSTAGYPMLGAYVVSGDFEGTLSIALGLAGGTKYRIGELPGRIYVDVAW